MKPFTLKVDRFLGGVSEDSGTGLAGAFRNGSYNIDPRADSKQLRVSRRVVDDAGVQVTKLIKWMETRLATNDLYLYGEDTVYVKPVNTSTYTAIKTFAGDSPNGQGLREFNGVLFARTSTQLASYNYGTGVWTDNAQTGLTACANLSPMCVVKNKLLIGHGRYVATLDDIGTWVLNDLTLPPEYNVRSIFRAGSYARILATKGTAITDSDEGMLFSWNTTSDVYNEFIPLDGNPHAGIGHKNKMFLITGQKPTIQESQGGVSDAIQNLPGIEDGEYAEVYPGAIDIWNGLIYFGISAGTAATMIRVVYTWGSKNIKFPDCLVPEHAVDTGTITGTNLKITAIKKVGTTVYIAYQDNGVSHVAKINPSLYQNSGVYNSLVFDNETPFVKQPKKLLIELTKKILTGQSVTGKVSSNPYDDPTFVDSTSCHTETSTDTESNLVEVPLTQSQEEGATVASRDIHFQITLTSTPDHTTAPIVKRVWMPGSEENAQV